MELWPKIQKLYPDMKFKLITFENTIENAREILANLGQNIDVVAGIFDDSLLEFLKSRFVLQFLFITGWQRKMLLL